MADVENNLCEFDRSVRRTSDVCEVTFDNVLRYALLGMLITLFVILVCFMSDVQVMYAERYVARTKYLERLAAQSLSVLCPPLEPLNL